MLAAAVNGDGECYRARGFNDSGMRCGVVEVLQYPHFQRSGVPVWLDRYGVPTYAKELDSTLAIATSV